MDEYKGKVLDSVDIQSRILAINAATSHTSSYVRTFGLVGLNLANRNIDFCAGIIEYGDSSRLHAGVHYGS